MRKIKYKDDKWSRDKIATGKNALRHIEKPEIDDKFLKSNFEMEDIKKQF